MNPTTRQLTGTSVLIIAIMLMSYGSVSAVQNNSTMTNPVIGGGPSVYPCNINGILLLCSVPAPNYNSTNVCTAANIGTSSCNLPNNGCDGVYRISIGRCAEGTGTCTILAGATTCIQVTTYATPFTNNPDFRYVMTTLASGFAGSKNTVASIKTDYMFLASNSSVRWNKYPAAVTEWMNQPQGPLANGGYPIQQQLNWTGKNVVRMEIGCDSQNPAATYTGNEVLELQYSLTDINNGGFSWVNFTQINVSNTNCAFGYPTLSQTAFVAIPAAAQTQVFLQLVGWGGNGVATNYVDFSYVKLEAGSTITTLNDVITCVDGTNILTPPKTRINVQCQSAIAPPTGQTTIANYKWQTWGYLG